jgi:hypothetical protein
MEGVAIRAFRYPSELTGPSLPVHTTAVTSIYPLFFAKNIVVAFLAHTGVWSSSESGQAHLSLHSYPCQESTRSPITSGLPTTSQPTEFEGVSEPI